MKLWYDDIRRPPNEDGWLWARTNAEAKLLLLVHEFTEASLDHDMGLHEEDPDEQDADLRIAPDRWEYESGMQLVKWMCDNECVPPVITIHSWNPDGADNMASYLRAWSQAFEKGLRVTVRRYARTESP